MAIRYGGYVRIDLAKRRREEHYLHGTKNSENLTEIIKSANLCWVKKQ